MENRTISLDALEEFLKTYSKMDGNKVQCELHLENSQISSGLPCKEDYMAKKDIDRIFIWNGEQIHIRAHNETEYAEKVYEVLLVKKGRETTPVEPPAPIKHDFKEYAENWYKTFAKPNICTVTSVTYMRELELVWYPGFKGMAIEDITPSDVQNVFNNMGDVTKETKNKAKIVLNQIFEQAVEDGYIPRNPLSSRSIRITGRQSKTTQVYPLEDMQFFVSHIGDIQKPMERAYFALQIMHPMRLEEVLGLKYEDLDTENGLIHIRRSVSHPTRNMPEIKATKTEASRRDIALAMSVLRYIPEGQPDHYFIVGGEKPMSYTEVRNMCNHIRKDIGYTGTISPLRFRTTVLTDIYAATKDIKKTQEAAGHTTATMTLKHYVKSRNCAEENTAAVVESMYGVSE